MRTTLFLCSALLFLSSCSYLRHQDEHEVIAAIDVLHDSLFSNIDQEEDYYLDVLTLNKLERTYNRIALRHYETEVAKSSRYLDVIDIDKEFALFGELISSLTNVCDSVSDIMAGSGSWVVWSNIGYIEINYKKNMYRTMLDLDISQMKTLKIHNEIFDKECRIMIENYRQGAGDGPDTSPEDARRIMNGFKDKFHKWQNYRESVSKKIKNKKLREKYETITEGKAREIFVHLKNRFIDMGMMSDLIGDIMIDGNTCTDEELINYSFEEQLKIALEEFEKDRNKH